MRMIKLYGEEIEIKCPLWLVCGGAPMRHCYEKQARPRYDEGRNFIETFCGNESQYLECRHYQIRKAEGKGG